MRTVNDHDSSLAVRRQAYEHYAALKGWDRPFSYTADLAAAFAGELGTDRLDGKTLLEVGFGEGGLLAWARDRGAQVVGAEIDEKSLAEAAERGVELIPVDLARAAPDNAGRFDYIVAFDVFEHLSLPEIDAALRACAAMLKPEGRLLLRFPNAESPFGLAVQHKDITHVTPLSGAQLRQIVAPMPLELISVRGAYRVRGHGPAKRLVRSAQFLLQDIIQLLVRFAFMNMIDQIAPVVTAQLMRSPASRAGPAGSAESAGRAEPHGS